MRREVFVVLAIMSLVIGASLPLIMSNILSETYKPVGTSVTPTYELSSPYEEQQVNISLINLGDLRKFSSYEELAQYLRSLMSLNTLVNQLVRLHSSRLDVLKEITGEGYVTPQQEVTTLTSKTNVQVEGIDEPDIVKNNAELIVVASGDKVFIVGVPRKTVLSVLILNEYVSGLFLHKNKLVVITETYVRYPITPDIECRCFVVPPGTPNVNTYVYDISNASNPVLLSRISVTGSMLSSRLSGNYLYVITNTLLNESIIPLINDEPAPLETLVVVDIIPNSYTLILALNLDKLDYTTYTFLTGGGSWLYMSLNNLYVARETRFSFLDAYIQTLKTFTNHLPNETASKIIELINKGWLDIAREKIEDYLLSMDEESRKELLSKVINEVNKEPKYDSTTFYVFSIDGLTISLRGSFNVSGHLLDQFAMEEAGNYFITATTGNNYSVVVSFESLVKVYAIVGKETETHEIVIQECSASGCVSKKIPVVINRSMPQVPYEYTRPTLTIYMSVVGETSNNVFVIDLTSLQIVGSLIGLAREERIYSARLIGNIFFLVTFRQVDPLFAIDISDPSNPRVLGFLKIPGFSEYLHPLPENMLLGIGVEGSNLKISLFNVSDPTNMNEVSKVIVYSAWSQALHDYHAVTVYPEKEIIMIPLTSYVMYHVPNGALVVSYRNNTLRVETILPHEYCLRITYVDKELFTISLNLIKIFDANTYEELGQIILEKS
ncbi:MAG: beta-propeller domain-containing protein [Desulfurococcaceae archaeon TW002]